jgi:hypothetical protein
MHVTASDRRQTTLNAQLRPSYTHARTRARILICTHKRARTRTHTHTHKHAHAQAQAQAQAQAHTRFNSDPPTHSLTNAPTHQLTMSPPRSPTHFPTPHSLNLTFTLKLARTCPSVRRSARHRNRWMPRGICHRRCSEHGTRSGGCGCRARRICVGCNRECRHRQHI